MKVLQISSVCGLGSTGRIATDIAATLRENKIESYIAYGRETSINNDHILRIGTKLDYYMHGGLTRLFDTHALLGSSAATRRFIEQVKKIDPDVIHLHNIHGYYLNIKILFDYLKTSGKPVVWTLHDCWSFTGHCAHFSYAQCDRWIRGCHDCPQRKSYPASAFIDNSKRNYLVKKELFTSLENMTIVTPSQWLADLVAQSFLAKFPVRIIHNGIDTDVFKPVASQLVRDKFKLGDKFIILGVASIWGQRKGLNHFMELSKMIDDDCVIVLVGLNEKQMAGLPPNIIGIKRTANINELAQIYSAADVFVNPSVEETFGLVTAEALACGTPAIVFDSTPGEEIVVDGCGYVAEISNIDAMREFIDQVRRDGKAAYSEQCVKRINNFDKRYRFEDYIELYERLLDVRGKNS
jgi:glycosyltransferase involved in cell wall biosynthesis